jgi:hypothetical protein
MTLPILFFSFLFINLSIVGYGCVVHRVIIKNNEDLDLGYVGIFGISFLIIYSYISHYFTAHTQYHNLFFNLIGLIFFLIFFNKKYVKEYFIFFFLIFVLFVSALLFKNHDDFPYYHFGYTYFLTQSDMVLGSGVFNHGFRTPSSIFYLNSLFYLPVVNFYTFHFGAILVLGFVNLILIKKIMIFFSTNKFNFIFYLSILVIAFINIFFSRVAEHGTDISAQILAFLLIIEILTIVNFNLFLKERLNKIFVLIATIISFKSFFILYFFFFIYIFYYLFFFNKILIKDIIYKNTSFFYSVVLVSVVLIASFQNSGCFLYPIVFSCFDKFSWSINLTEVKLMSEWYELWSKGGAAPNFRVSNPETYIKGFNWLPNWFQIYFFNKVSDTLAGLLLLITVFFLTFYKKNNKKIIQRKYKIILLITFLLMLEWFYYHPALRYGGYSLIVLILFIPLSIILENSQIYYKKIGYRTITILIVTLVIFLGRNFFRINSENIKYHYNPIKEANYNVEKNFFDVPDQISTLIDNFIKCKDDQECINKINDTDGFKINRFLGRYIFFK